MKSKNNFRLTFVLMCALTISLSACQQHELLGYWEADAKSTVAQYERFPTGYESTTLAEFQNSLSNKLVNRAYWFTSKHPGKPDWGETNFLGSVEIRREEKKEFYGAWRTSTIQPRTYEIFAYTVNSGASYWRAGNIRTGTNHSRALWYQDPEDKPLVLRRE